MAECPQNEAPLLTFIAYRQAVMRQFDLTGDKQSCPTWLIVRSSTWFCVKLGLWG